MRLPSCDKWHPESPSQITMWLGGWRDVRGRKRNACKLCVKIRKGLLKAERSERIQETKVGQPYGIIPLNWPAPEGV